MRKQPNRPPDMPRPPPPAPPPSQIRGSVIDTIHSMGVYDPSISQARQIELMFGRCIERSTGFNAGKKHDNYYQSKYAPKPIYCGYCNEEIIYEFGVFVSLVNNITCCESCENQLEIEREKTRGFSMLGRFLDFLVILWRLIK